jgi:hypothetical protein
MYEWSQVTNRNGLFYLKVFVEASVSNILSIYNYITLEGGLGAWICLNGLNFGGIIAKCEGSFIGMHQATSPEIEDVPLIKTSILVALPFPIKAMMLNRCLSLLLAVLLSTIASGAVTISDTQNKHDESHRDVGSNQLKIHWALTEADGDPVGAGETVTVTIGTDIPSVVLPPGAEVVYQYEYIDAVVVQMDKELLPVVEENSGVAYVAEQAAVVKLRAETVPPGIPLIQANDPIVPPPDRTKPCFNICVVDSGFDITHEDLVCIDFVVLPTYAVPFSFGFAETLFDCFREP